MIEGCKQARLASRVCDVLEAGQLELQNALELHSEMRREYDPDVDPYLWEI